MPNAEWVEVRLLYPTEVIAGKTSVKKIDRLAQSFERDGFAETILVVEHQGSLYILDGHHRYEAALKLKPTTVLVRKVSLPFGGFDSIEQVIRAHADCHAKRK